MTLPVNHPSFPNLGELQPFGVQSEELLKAYNTLSVNHILIYLLYYMPVYFQACMDTSPIISRVDIFGLAFGIAPSTLLISLSTVKTYQYQPQIWLSWSLAIIGMGLFTTLQVDSSWAKVISSKLSWILAVTVRGTVLQNELGKYLPPMFSVQFPQGTLMRCLANPPRGLGSRLSHQSGHEITPSPLYTEVDKKWGINDLKDGVCEKAGSEMQSTTSIEPA
ncbi:hypothetical protein DFH08DRAFT_822121 [Mycena albidolilacea]|uniref:Uncharacterized protein n=1 Tax=Mycena albidolilacea TaxID=1033008 RepID=A0AAD6Z8I6_9AGAR|nr:hypothetical protein DFH08DRAFT_822121 [Mycena albidolilacea]